MPESKKPPPKPQKAKSSARRIGRPSLYSEQLANHICSQLAAGETLTDICKADGMPSRDAVADWQRSNEAFAAQCARARELGVEARLDAMEDIAKQTLAGVIEPNAAKVAISLAQWKASKIMPKTYGDKLEANVNASISLIDLVNQAMTKRNERLAIEAQPLEMSVDNDTLAGDKDKEDQ